MNLLNIPEHIAIIPDGNRRWARQNNLADLEGHKRGYESIMQLATNCRDLGIKYFTVWFFSTENWRRSDAEVSFLMKFAEKQIDSIAKKFLENKVHFKRIGRKSMLSPILLKKFDELEEKTKDFSDFFFNLAFDYGGREEIVSSVKNIIEDKIPAEKITEDLFSGYLYTKGTPDVDLIIRPGGEKRLSGFMPWQSTYSEIYFSDVLCPDFNIEKLKEAITWFSFRDRRVGGNSKVEDKTFVKVEK